jgi:hypothetical protein
MATALSPAVAAEGWGATFAVRLRCCGSPGVARAQSPGIGDRVESPTSSSSDALRRSHLGSCVSPYASDIVVAGVSGEDWRTFGS